MCKNSFKEKTAIPILYYDKQTPIRNKRFREEQVLISFVCCSNTIFFIKIYNINLLYLLFAYLLYYSIKVFRFMMILWYIFIDIHLHAYK